MELTAKEKDLAIEYVKSKQLDFWGCTDFDKDSIEDLLKKDLSELKESDITDAIVDEFLQWHGYHFGSPLDDDDFYNAYESELKRGCDFYDAYDTAYEVLIKKYEDCDKAHYLEKSKKELRELVKSEMRELIIFERDRLAIKLIKAVLDEIGVKDIQSASNEDEQRIRDALCDAEFLASYFKGEDSERTKAITERAYEIILCSSEEE